MGTHILEETATLHQTSIWIYCTNLNFQNSALAEKILNSESDILKWSVDHEDVDKVLRIECKKLEENFIPRLLAKSDLHCIPMMDEIN